jgi:recombination DNA repair RAD52 pathway protein
VFAFNAEGGSAPEFISPDVKQAGMIIQAVTKIVGEIYHSIGMAGERTKEDNAAGIDNSSGVAKAYDFEKLNAMLAAKARALQNVEKNMIRLVNAWNGDVKELEETDDFVTYPQTFDVRNLSDEMDNAQRLSVMNAPKLLRRAQMERLAVKMFPQAAEKDLKKITDDIEKEWLEEPELDPMAAAAGAPTLGKGRVPGKKNSQGENNKGSVKADDKAKEEK